MMDEKFLSDILECSVCLEGLDHTSKVLPCQHTFCRRCLDEIVFTKKELRCPECRVVVTLKVEELPTNILLCRLLEGLRMRSPIAPHAALTCGMSQLVPVAGVPPAIPARSNIKAGISTVPQISSSAPHTNYQFNNRSSTTSSSQSTSPRLGSRAPIHSTQAKAYQPCARALYDYTAAELGDLSFNAGDIITLKKAMGCDWFHGELRGVYGFFPASYVQVLSPIHMEPPQAKALYDFKLSVEQQQQQDEKECLQFKKGSVISVTRKVDENWAEGKLSSKLGIFPISFVEMNATARALMKLGSSKIQAVTRVVPPTPTSTNILVSPSTLSTTSSTLSTTSSTLSATSSTLSTTSSTLSATSSTLSATSSTLSATSSTLSMTSVTQTNVTSVTAATSSTTLQTVDMLSGGTVSTIISTSAPLSSPASSSTSSSDTSGSLSPRHGLDISSSPCSSSTSSASSPVPMHHEGSEPTHAVVAELRAAIQQQLPSSQIRRSRNRFSMVDVTPGMGGKDSHHRLSVNIPSHIPMEQMLSNNSRTPPLLQKLQSSLESSSPAVVTSSPAVVTSSPAVVTSSPAVVTSLATTLTSLATTSTSLANEGLVCQIAVSSTPSITARTNTSQPISSTPTNLHGCLVVASTAASSPAIPIRTNYTMQHKYVSLYSYNPQKDDEVELRKGDVYYVNEKCQDGWFRGVCLRTGKSGVFPGNYVQPCKSSPPPLPARPASTITVPPPVHRVTVNTQVPPPASTADTTPTHIHTSSPIMGLSGRSAAQSRAAALPSLFSHTANTSCVPPPNVSLVRQQPKPHHPQQQQQVSQHFPSSSIISGGGGGSATTCSSKLFKKRGDATSSQPSSSSSSSAMTKVGNFVRRVTSGGSGRKRVSSKSHPSPAPADSTSLTCSSQGPTTSKSSKHARSWSMPSNTPLAPAGSSQPTCTKMRRSLLVPSSKSSAARNHPSASSTPSATVAEMSSSSNIIGSTGDPTVTTRPKQPQPLIRERFKCVVPYPPNSDYELELKMGDVVYVYRKRDDGWYKGTLQRTGKNGLFPGNFVEKC